MSAMDMFLSNIQRQPFPNSVSLFQVYLLLILEGKGQHGTWFHVLYPQKLILERDWTVSFSGGDEDDMMVSQ